MLTPSSNNVFTEIVGDGAGEFDWGRQFYFGQNVYLGLEGTESSLSAFTGRIESGGSNQLTYG
jgi:hypothetical protein